MTLNGVVHSKMQDDAVPALDSMLSFLSQFDLPGDGTPRQRDGLIVPRIDVTDAGFGELLLSPLGLTRSSSGESTNGFNVDELLAELTKHSDTSDGTSSSDGARAVKNQKKTGKPPRVSHKEQICHLRETVKELTVELQSLRPQWQSEGNSGKQQLIPRGGSMWQEIASRQLERRRESEGENAKLREMLVIQVREAKNLKRVLKRRANIERLEDMMGVKRQKSLLYTAPKDNPQVFASLLQDADELYVGVDALFEEKGVYNLPCPGRSRDAKSMVVNGVFLELNQRHRIPFGARKTSRAMWKALSRMGVQGVKKAQKHSPDTHYYGHHIEEENNTLRMSFCVDLPPATGNRAAQFQNVGRKYVENDRVVFIYKTLMGLIPFENSAKTTFQTRTTLQIVVREDEEQTSIPSEDGVSIIESHFIATRYCKEPPTPAQTNVNGPNLDTGIATWDAAISGIVHQVETLVLDDARE